MSDSAEPKASAPGLERNLRLYPRYAALFSALLPGAGQLYAGRTVRALVVAAPLLLLIAVLIFLVSDGAVGVLELAVRPVVIWSVLGINLGILGWRLFAIADAYA